MGNNNSKLSVCKISLADKYKWYKTIQMWQETAEAKKSSVKANWYIARKGNKIFMAHPAYLQQLHKDIRFYFLKNW